MKKDQLVKALNRFLLLEKGQVAIYDAQQKHLQDQYLSNAFKRFRDIEAGHVQNITQKIQELGGDPSEFIEVANHPLGEVLVQYGGSGVGVLLEAAGVKTMLKTNIAVEEKARKDYYKLIEKVDDPGVSALLWNNMIDEELHGGWMQQWLNKN